MNKKIRSILMAALVAVVSTVAFTGCKSLFEETDVVYYWVTNNTDHEVTLKAYSMLSDYADTMEFTVPADASSKIYEHTLRTHSKTFDLGQVTMYIRNETDNKAVSSFTFYCDKNGSKFDVVINSDGTTTVK